MRIAIIGAGNIGGNLTRRLAALGHEVRVANSRGPETLADLVEETGATAVPVTEVTDGAELVIVTIPMKAVPSLPAEVFAKVPAEVPVIDTNNYYPQQRDGRIAEIEDGTTESNWVSAQLGRPVVKVFNGIYAAHLLTHGRPAGDPQRRALPVAGADGPAKQAVMELVDSLGFDPVDAGDLDASWRQQPGTPVYGADADAEGVRSLLDAASPDRAADWRA